MLSYFAVPAADGWWKKTAVPDGCIKIGETSNPHRRRLDLRVTFLALDSTPERELHRMFREERCARREHFTVSERLLDYIEQRVGLLWPSYLEMGWDMDDSRAWLAGMRANVCLAEAA